MAKMTKIVVGDGEYLYYQPDHVLTVSEKDRKTKREYKVPESGDANIVVDMMNGSSVSAGVLASCAVKDIPITVHSRDDKREWLIVGHRIKPATDTEGGRTQ